MRRQFLKVAAAAAAVSMIGQSAIGQSAVGQSAVAQSTLTDPACAETFGVWRNPKDNVRVEIRPCGAAACGTVIWASQRAQAKAREAGTTNLIGTQVLKNLEFDARRRVWRGKVFVPELNRNFTGIAEPVAAGRLLAKGCIVGGLFCKSQVWTKIA